MFLAHYHIRYSFKFSLINSWKILAQKLGNYYQETSVTIQELETLVTSCLLYQ